MCTYIYESFPPEPCLEKNVINRKTPSHSLFDTDPTTEPSTLVSSEVSSRIASACQCARISMRWFYAQNAHDGRRSNVRASRVMAVTLREAPLRRGLSIFIRDSKGNLILLRTRRYTSIYVLESNCCCLSDGNAKLTPWKHDISTQV